jgi:V/A-type H+-transporting ATPase subunit K
MSMQAARRWIAPIAALATLTLVFTSIALLLAWPALAAETANPPVDPMALKWGFAAAAASAGLAALGAGYAVAQVGTAALGALAEKPELFGRVLVLVGLAEGIAIYGLIVAVLIFNRVT